MFNIGPIDYNNSNYHMVRTRKKVTPISGVNKVSNDRSNSNSNSSSFGRNLD